MKIPTREEYFKKLRSDPLYLALLKKAPAEERKQIINTVEYVAGTMLEALTLGVGAMKEDPQTAQDLIEALKTGSGIIKESDGTPIAKKPEEK